MKHFPKTQTKNETSEFISRQKNQYKENGYNYFATEIIKTGEFIEFIGLAFQGYETDFTPATDIGWRLKKVLGEMDMQLKEPKSVLNLDSRK